MANLPNSGKNVCTTTPLYIVVRKIKKRKNKTVQNESVGDVIVHVWLYNKAQLHQLIQT